jgi:hypothetical protein
MKTYRYFGFLFVSTLLVVSCSGQQFSGDSGAASGKKTKNPPSTPALNPTDPDSSDMVSDDGTVKLVDTELSIDRLQDSAAFQNCLFAHIVGQPVIEFGCNRNAPKSEDRPPLVRNIKLKLKTNECNEMRVYFKTNSGSGLRDNVSTANAARISSGASKQGKNIAGPGINVIKEPSGSILIEANDNTDRDWHDVYLRINRPANATNIKFTIENSGIPCD